MARRRETILRLIWDENPEEDPSDSGSADMNPDNFRLVRTKGFFSSPLITDYDNVEAYEGEDPGGDKLWVVYLTYEDRDSYQYIKGLVDFVGVCSTEQGAKKIADHTKTMEIGFSGSETHEVHVKLMRVIDDTADTAVPTVRKIRENRKLGSLFLPDLLL